MRINRIYTYFSCAKPPTLPNQERAVRCYPHFREEVMHPFRYAVLLLGLLCATTALVFAQNEPQFQSYSEQGQRYEKQGDYHKALDAYRKAQSYSSPTNRKLVDRTVAHLEDLIQQQMLVNQAQADGIQRSIATIASSQNRKRLQDALSKLQQRDDATPADFQSLARRVDAAKQVETQLGKEAIVSRSPPPPRPTNQPRRTPTPKPVGGPPPKSVTNRMPGNTPGDVSNDKNNAKTTKSAGPLLRGGGKSN